MKYYTCHAKPLVSFLCFLQNSRNTLSCSSSLVSFFLFHLLFNCRSFENLLRFIYLLYAPILFLYFHSLSRTILNSACLLSFHSTRRQPLCISNPGTYYMKINKNKQGFMFPSAHISFAMSVYDTYFTLF